MKKRILFVYSEMYIGGSTTSLLGLLANIDYSLYDVDLLLYQNQGNLLDKIPNEVKILPQACKAKNKKHERMLKLINPCISIRKMYCKFSIAKRKKYPLFESQNMCYGNALISRKIRTKYDVSVAFLEGWPTIYVSKYVEADQKIAWVHVDYEQAGLCPKVDENIYSQFSKIITVSKKCKDNFQKSFPNFSNRVLFIGNISLINEIKSKSLERCELIFDKKFMNLISVCRLSIRHKGLDRLIRFINYRITNGDENIRLYIIGDGEDKNQLKLLINELHLENNVFLLGSKINPFPYILQADVFVMLSRYEGKPMVITEAMILDVPCIVTEYASASEQIDNGVNGYIVKNNDGDLYESLNLLINSYNINQIKNNLVKKPVSFAEEIREIDNLLSGDL